MLHTLIKHYKTQEEDIAKNMCVNEMGISGRVPIQRVCPKSLLLREGLHIVDNKQLEGDKETFLASERRMLGKN